MEMTFAFIAASLIVTQCSATDPDSCGTKLSISVDAFCLRNSRCVWEEQIWEDICTQHCQTCTQSHVQCGQNGPMPSNFSFPYIYPSVINLELDGNFFTTFVFSFTSITCQTASKFICQLGKSNRALGVFKLFSVSLCRSFQGRSHLFQPNSTSQFLQSSH